MSPAPSGPMGPQTPLLALYDQRYRPARQPGDPQSNGCEAFRTDIRNFARPRQFREWLLLKTEASKAGKSTAELYCDFQRALQQGFEPAWWPAIEDLTDENLHNAMAFLIEAGRAIPTANKLFRHISALREFARDEGHISSPSKAKKYREPRKAPVAFLPDEFDRVIDAAEQEKGYVGEVPAKRWYPGAIYYVWNSALRIEAAFETPTATIDFVRGEFLAPWYVQKQRADQWLDLFPSVIERLREWKLVERGVKTVLGDWPYEIQPLLRAFKRIQVRAGLFADVGAVPRSHGFHILRKTFASMLYQKAGIHVVSQRLGHSSIQVTERYIDPRYKTDPRVCDLLDDPRPLLPFDDPDPFPSPPDLPGQLRLFTGEAG